MAGSGHNEFRLLCVTELDYDGPEIIILSVSMSAPGDRVFTDLGAVIQHVDGRYVLTALTSALDDDGDEAAEWLQTRCDELQSTLDVAMPVTVVRDAVISGLGLDAIDWTLLDAQYEQKRAA